jgi:U3 small nucleolar RNA-associated protein 21
VWDLEKKKLHSMLQSAHDAALVSLYFLPGQPVLVSSGADNSLKEWIFDETDGSARLLKARAGHARPPTKCKFYEAGQTALASGSLTTAGCAFFYLFLREWNNNSLFSLFLLSLSHLSLCRLDGSLRYFSVIRDQHSGELSQGHLEKKSKRKHVALDALRLAPIVDFDSTQAKETRWANIVSCHQDDGAAYAWSFARKALEARRLLNPDRASSLRPVAACTCVCLSSCGNFAMLGFADGALEKFNMQSAFFRGSFPPQVEPSSLAAKKNTPSDRASKRSKLEFKFLDTENSHARNDPAPNAPAGPSTSFSAAGPAHAGAVAGVCVDGLNREVVSVGVDGKIHFWSFASHQKTGSLLLGSPVFKFAFHKGSELMAVVTEDLLVIFDRNKHTTLF